MVEVEAHLREVAKQAVPRAKKKIRIRAERDHKRDALPLPFPCVPDRPYKILLVQVGTLSFPHPSFGVPFLFTDLFFMQ